MVGVTPPLPCEPGAAAEPESILKAQESIFEVQESILDAQESILKAHESILETQVSIPAGAAEGGYPPK